MATKKLTPLSRAETEILTLLWDLGHGTVQEVWASLPHGRRITYATVQTLLRRMEKKGYVAHEVEGKAHVFKPIVERDEVVQRSVTDFVDRLFGGDPVPLMLRLADHAQLSRGDIEQLKKLISKDQV
jgi:BlaI family penicillinase repressor